MKVLSGSFRPASRLYKARALSSPICPFCDTGEEETKEHCFWRCPRWKPIRDEALGLLQQHGFQRENQNDPTSARSGTPALWWCGLMNEDPALEEALTKIEDEDFVVDPPPQRTTLGAEEEPGAVAAAMQQFNARLNRRNYGSFGFGLEPEPLQQDPPRAIIEHVQIGTPAYFADMQQGDEILKLNGMTPEEAGFHEQRWQWELSIEFQGSREIETGEQWVGKRVEE